MTPILGWIIFAVWLYVLWVTRRSELPAWHFICGSCGLFVLMMIFLRPYCTQPLAQVVAALAGGFGKLTGMFQSYFKYGVIFVNTRAGAISLLIDFECSGILEIIYYSGKCAEDHCNLRDHLCVWHAILLCGTYLCGTYPVLRTVRFIVLLCIYQDTDHTPEGRWLYVWN